MLHVECANSFRGLGTARECVNGVNRRLIGFRGEELLVLGLPKARCAAEHLLSSSRVFELAVSGIQLSRRDRLHEELAVELLLFVLGNRRVG